MHISDIKEKKILNTQGVSASLPEGWEERVLSDGRTVYLNHTTHKTQWERPSVSASLPEGWEERVLSDGRTVYLNHTTHKTQWERPNVSASLPEGWEERVLSDGRTVYLNHTTHETQWERPDVSFAPDMSSCTKVGASSSDHNDKIKGVSSKDYNSCSSSDVTPSAPDLSDVVPSDLASCVTAPSAPPMSPVTSSDAWQYPSTDRELENEREDLHIDFDPMSEGIPKNLEQSGVDNILKENERLREERTCKICLDAQVSCVFVPCGHFVCCFTCASELSKCPICRRVIEKSIKTFM